MDSESVRRGGPRRITILGSTGSVGTQTIDLIARDRDAFHIVALTAGKNVDLLIEQARALKPELAVIADKSLYARLKDGLAGTNIAAAAGCAAVEDAARCDSDWVMSAIVGIAGLPATLAAARRGATIAFANKETLVCAGALMMKLVADAGATLLPVDSEHNAIWQVFDQDQRHAVSRLIITASGGPFRSKSREEMRTATLEQALKHPVWSMGPKISIDSATLMNKALEMIEAHFLFQMPPEKIEVVVHPQSVIHSLVEYDDGTVLAQLGTPDMRIPIAYTLAWPARMTTPVARLDFAQLGQLTFEASDPEKFPALRLGREAMARGGTAPASLNAANEVAVAAFIDRRIGFLDIERINQAVLASAQSAPLDDLDVLEEVDREARRLADAEMRRIVS